MRGTLTPTGLRRTGALLLCAVVVLSSMTPAFALTPAEKIAEARRQAQAAERKMDQLSTRLEAAGEDYLAAKDALAKTDVRIRVATAELGAAEREQAEAQAQLNRRATSIYRGGDVGILSVFVGVTDFEDFVTRVDLLQRVGRSDASIVVRLDEARERVERNKHALENRRAEQTVLLQRTRAEQAKVDAALKDQKSYLSSVNGRLKRLVAEERARQERLARERAEAKARREAAARRASAAASAASRPAHTASPTPPSLPASHGSVVSIARSFVGVTPYVWGGTTPSGFDCSGLTQYCYAQIGVSLPRTSRSQYYAGTHIPADRLDLLKPGDLVFFGQGGQASNIHHVGIYSGNGMFIHAPQTGMDVSESSLLARIATRSDYVGAVRP